MKTIDASACTPENVKRLMLQIHAVEDQLSGLLAQHNAKVEEVKAAARCSPDRAWSDVIDRITAAVEEHLAPDAMLPSRMAELRKCYDAAMRCSEGYGRRSRAYSDVIEQIEKLARSRDPDLICYSGADMLAITATLKNNPDA